MSYKFGVDEHSRYLEYPTGERVAVEPYPYRNPLLKLRARLSIMLWHLGMINEHGFRQWNKERKY